MIWKEQWKVYKNVFSQFSLRNLEKLANKGYFKDLKSPISTGKEANIFSAVNSENDFIIVKIFRLENAEFNKMRSYLVADPRYVKLKNSKRQIIFSWAQREYRNLLLAREYIRVPTPIAFKDNIILMELIGDDGSVAPMLKDAYPQDAQKFFDDVIKMIKKLWKNGWVHGDLSAFNILNYHDKPVFIDLSQMTSKKSPLGKELLERDVKNICRFFKRDLKVKWEDVLEKI
jgi:RIO kinase 1